MFRRAVRAVAGYVPGEQPRDRRTIKLNTNENPYPPSPKVLEAVQAAASADLRLYPQPMADDLRERAARAYGLRPENVLAGNGSDELLTLIVRAVVEAATRVAFPVPGYSLYQTLVDLEDGDVHAVPFPEDFSLPEALVSAPARLVLLANPNSPSGTLIPPDEIRRLLERKNRLVVVDEAYVDFADANCLGLLADHPNLIVLRTFSKSYSLAGMRIGLALAAEPVIATLAKIKDSYNVGRLALVAAEVALRESRWMEANVRKIRRTREQLSESLAGLGFHVYPSQANFVMARWRGRDLGPVQEMLRRRGVLVRHFATPELRDSLRITVGTDDEIATFLRVLRRVLVEATA
jgi:histidinol-phosphate aminotransferase